MNNRQPESEILSWILIAVAFAMFWPAGIFLLLRKLKLMTAFKQGYNAGGARGGGDMSNRFERYLRIVEGNDSMPIEHIASAAGVSYETALREIRQMLTQGRFGKDAYINYLTKTLFVRTPGGAAAAPSNTPSGARPKEGEAARKQNGRRLPSTGGTEALLAVLGVLMLFLAGIIGAVSFGALLDSAISFGGAVWFLITALCCGVGGIAALASRRSLRKRARRFAKYVAVLGDRKLMELSALASAVGVSESTVVRDLETMIEKGIFEKSSYVDLGLGCLILSPDARPEYSEPEPEQPPENQYSAILREIRDLNDRISDPSVSARISTIEEITAKIFKIVEEKPEKLPQIKSFMSYYLPTTLKLLRSYATFEKQGIEGENIDSARRDIERILDTLSKGFAQQLDQLFSADVLDISSDIDVLESMMKKDGLADDASEFHVAGGH